MESKICTYLLVLFLTQCHYDAKRVQDKRVQELLENMMSELDHNLGTTTTTTVGKVCSLKEKKDAGIQYRISFRGERDCSNRPIKCWPFYSLVEVVPTLFKFSRDTNWCTCLSSHVEGENGAEYEFKFMVTPGLKGQDECSSPACWNMYSDAMLQKSGASGSENRLNMPDHWDGKCVDSTEAINSGLVALLDDERSVLKDIRVKRQPNNQRPTSPRRALSDVNATPSHMVATKKKRRRDSIQDSIQDPQKRNAKRARSERTAPPTIRIRSPRNSVPQAPKDRHPSQREGEARADKEADMPIPPTIPLPRLEDKRVGGPHNQSENGNQCVGAGQCFLARAYTYAVQFEKYAADLRIRGNRRNLRKQWGKLVSDQERLCRSTWSDDEKVRLAIANAIVNCVLTQDLGNDSPRGCQRLGYYGPDDRGARIRHLTESVNWDIFGTTYGRRGDSKHWNYAHLKNGEIQMLIGEAMAKLREYAQKYEAATEDVRQANTVDDLVPELKVLRETNCR